MIEGIGQEVERIFGVRVIAGDKVDRRLFDLDDAAAEATSSLSSRLMAVACPRSSWLLGRRIRRAVRNCAVSSFFSTPRASSGAGFSAGAARVSLRFDHAHRARNSAAAMPSGREFRYGKACGQQIHMVVAQHDIRNRKRTNFVQAWAARWQRTGPWLSTSSR